MNKLFSPSLAMWLLLASSGLGADALNLTLADAVRRALAKNFLIRMEEFTPKIARAQQKSTAGTFDPTAQLSYNYNYQEQAGIAVDPISGNPANVDLVAISSGQVMDGSLSGLLPTGLRYDLGATLNVDDTSNRSYTRYNSFVGASIIQPLLRGFGTDVNLGALRIARANVTISQWQLRQRVMDVITQTVQVYNDLYFFIRNLEVEERTRDLAAQLLKDNMKRAEVGVMSPLDVVQAQADLAAREERVLVAERQMKDTENALKQLVTDNVSDVLSLQLSIVPPAANLDYKVDRTRDFAAAFELRPDYRQALLDLQKRNINLVFARNQILPRLDLLASLGLNGIDTGLSDSVLGTLSENNALSASIGGVVSVPIPNQYSRGQLDVAKLEIARALVDLKRIEQGILVESDNAAGAIETSRKRIDASRSARDYAAQTLDAAQTRLISGTSTTFEVLQFQRDLANAEISEVGALTDFNKAIAEYARRTGTTLRRYQIVAPRTP
ncbi:MAG TPA: TolC family protein [Chthoniobacterales bacterium]